MPRHDLCLAVLTSAALLGVGCTSGFGDPGGVKYEFDNQCGRPILVGFLNSSGLVFQEFEMASGERTSFGTSERHPSDVTVRVSHSDRTLPVDFRVNDPNVVLVGERCPAKSTSG